MLRLIKWFLGFLVTLAVLIIAAIIVIPMVFDPNDYRQDIAELVKKQTGRDLALDGELSVSVFPWLGIRTQGLTLSQPEEIGGDMVSVQNAQLRVKLAPLLSKQVHIDTVVLEQPKLRLVTLKNGVDSFAGLTGDEDDADTVTEEDSAGAAVALLIQGVELTDGHLLIDDRVEGTTTEISNLNVETGNLIGSSLADIDASGSMKSSDSPDVVSFDVSAQARIDIDTVAVQAKDIQANVMQGENVLAFNVGEFNFTEQSIIDISALSAQVKSPVSAAIRASKVAANLDAQTANIPELNIDAGELQGAIKNLKVTGFIDAPKGSGSLSIPDFNAAKLLKDFDIDYQTANPKALQKVALSALFSGSLDGAQVNDLQLTLDSSTLSGSASVANFDKPSTKFDLNLSSLNLDDYLPPSEDEEAEAEEAVSGGDALAVPMAVFKEINANGQFKAQQLIAGGLEMNNIDVQVRSTPGSVTITPTASLYDGSLDGQIAYSEQGEQAKLKVKNEIDLVQLGKMLNAAEVTDQLSGIGSLLVDLVVTEVNGKQSNQGVIKLQAKDGAIQGVDIKNMLDGAYGYYQAYKGKTKPPEENKTEKGKSTDETKFAEMFGTFNVNDNIVTNDDFTLSAPLFRIGGEGTINIEQQTLDYTVEVNVVASTDGQGGEGLENLKGIPIPIRFSGDLTAPSYSIDFKRMFKGLFANDIKRKKGELLQEKYGIEGGEELSTKGVLKGLLGKKLDEKINGEAPAKERPLTERNSQQQAVTQKAAPVSNKPAADVPAKPVDSQPAEDTRSEKDKAKDELKKKLLNSLFD